MTRSSGCRGRPPETVRQTRWQSVRESRPYPITRQRSGSGAMLWSIALAVLRLTANRQVGRRMAAPRTAAARAARRCPFSIVFPTQRGRCEPPSGCISHPGMRFSTGSLWGLRSYRDGDGPPGRARRYISARSRRSSGELATLDPVRVEQWVVYPRWVRSTESTWQRDNISRPWAFALSGHLCATSSPQVGVDVDAAPRRRKKYP